jgi:Flp pilus assembly protein protease CpaA
MYFPVLLLLTIFGLVTSYTDIKEGKIKNIWIVLMMLAALIANTFITKTFVEKTRESLVNAGLALLFAFSLWYFGFWTAGDGKLFFAYSLLLPITIYKYGIIQHFPSFVLVINSFTPVAIYLIITSLKRIKPKEFFKEVKKSFTLKNLISLLLYFAGFSFAIQLLFSFFSIKSNFLINTLIIFFIFEMVKEKRIIDVASVILVVARLILSPETILSIAFLKELVFMLLIFQSLWIFISLAITQLVEEVKIKDLKPGMVLAEGIMKKKGNWEKQSMSLSFFGIFKMVKASVDSEVINVLDEKTVKEIKKDASKGKVAFRKLKVNKTVPFAPILFLGVLLTFFAEGNIFIHLITAKDIVIGYVRYWLNA